MTVFNGTVELEDGTRAQREVIEHRGAAGVAAYTGDRVVLVRQFRIAAGKYLLEIPAGKLEAGDSATSRAEKELEEETGYRCRRLLPAGVVYPSAGILTERIHLFLGLDLQKTEQRLDEDERIEIVELPLEDVRARLDRHEFEDAKTVVALYALLSHLTKA